METLEFRVDVDAALLAVDARDAARRRKQVGPAEIDLGGSAAVLLADCLNGAGSHRNAIDRRDTVLRGEYSTSQKECAG